MTMNRAHQTKLFDPACSQHVAIVGAGSVGSFVVVQLARLGVPRMTVYDGDDVRSHNLPMSVFRPCDLGRLKAEVVGERAREEGGANVRVVTQMYDGTEPFQAGAVVACVDTMDARICVWERIRDNPSIGIYVDTRIHAHFISVFAICPTNPEHVKFYERHLYPMSTTPKRMCGTHGVIYVTSIAASLAVRALTCAWSGGTPKRHERLLLGTKGTHFEAS